MILSAQNCQCPLVDEGPSLVNSPICSGYLLFMVLLEGYLKGRCDIARPCTRIKSTNNIQEQYDFIVVGAGSAGSIVAGRLSESNKSTVLLIEAGGSAPIGSRVPSFYRTFLFNELVDWRYRTVSENYCLDQKGKGCMWPRGKVLGGTSILNGMMYHRGHPADFDDWVKAGATGWSWDENIKYFSMTECNKQIGSKYLRKYHSDSGNLPVQQFNHQPPMAYDILDAINETGLPLVDDMNNLETPEGFTIAQAFNAYGQRYTTADAYLEPKSNLDVLLKSHVTKVIINEGDKRAVGVEFIDEHGKRKTVYASKEVILSAGALNSPQILMLSGIGPQEVLEPLGIPVVQDLPVGKNMRNHYGITLNFLLTKVNNTDVLDWNVLTKYLLERKGHMTSTSVTQVTGLLYSSLADKSKKQPDIQFFFNGMYAECSKDGAIDGSRECTRAVNISTNAAILLPRSVGYTTINSTDPLAPPIFYPGYFSHSDDMIMIKDGYRYIRKIIETSIFQDKYGIELDPQYAGACKAFKEWSDDWMECMARIYTDPQNHQSSTTSIGLVVDPELRVYNIKGLRVIDASVMPTQVTGNPQGPIMMVAERGAAFIKNEYEL